MNFVILPAEGTMSIDNAMLELDTAPWVRGDVEIIAWQGEAGSGFLEYKADQRITEKITDLGIYQTAINAWIDAASRLPQSLQLAQAQQIKMDMVDALYMVKRKTPYWYGGYQYDTSDEAVAHMAAMATAQGGYDRIDELIGQVNAAFNTMKVGLDSIAAVNNGNADGINAMSGTMQSHWITLNVSAVGTTQSGYLQQLTSHGHSISAWNDRSAELGGYSPVSVPTFSYMSGLGAGSVGGGVVSIIRWQALNAPSPQDISAITFRDALRAIANQRTYLEGERARRKNYIRDYCTNIPTVIGYDVVGGW